MKYEFFAKPYECLVEKANWTFVSIPKNISIEIKENFELLEKGWGRIKVTVNIGNSEWETSMWFDTETETYSLPLKAAIRKKENIVLDKEVKVSICI
ncbi:DUF1905 domain-containing protein [Miniphocaeibacter massiliensis]|uniref:DUF1905 domain-containing protein n=1 Tax=Miniphocaeibacter massiliensis TaxID=2041841 RepID=UPI000C075E9D|nr:DUF1905 domain-containing protein [Miniphocaeibacter massiliensis]